MKISPGKKFRQALLEETPLQLVGTINAYMALMAKKVGYRAIYLSGAGIANSSYGVPDVGLTTLENVIEDAKRITNVCDLPLIVDIDTGFGNLSMIQKTIKSMIKAGVCGVHIEDQVFEKKCGHLEGKKIVSVGAMTDRIRACLDARDDPEFVIIARCDAMAIDGFDKMIERLLAYKEAGCDMIFPEALTTLDQYKKVKEICKLPVLANLTEFGKTPYFTSEKLKEANIDIALYPLTANRAANLAALKVYQEIRENGTQRQFLENLQTREELYYFLNYKE